MPRFAAELIPADLSVSQGNKQDPPMDIKGFLESERHSRYLWRRFPGSQYLVTPGNQR